MEVEILKRKFLEYFETERGRSRKTVENYDHYLSRFMQFVAKKVKKPEDITSEVVKKYVVWLSSYIVVNNGGFCNKKINVQTKNYHLSALRSFLKYLHEEGFLSLDPKKVKLAKIPARRIPVLPKQKEVQALFDVSSGENIKILRDRALLFLLFSTGLRVSDIHILTKEVEISGNTLFFQRKSGKEYSAPISADAQSALKKYLYARTDSSPALFVNNGKRVSSEGSTRLSVRSMQRIVKQYAVKAGLKNVTPQTLRHLHIKGM